MLCVSFSCSHETVLETTKIYYLSVASDIPFSTNNKSIPMIEPVSSFYLNFSEEIDSTTIGDSISLIDADSDKTVPLDFEVEDSRVRVYICNDNGILDSGTNYTLNISTNIKALTGHNLPKAVTGQFSTWYPVTELRKDIIVISDVHMGDKRAQEGFIDSNGNKIPPYSWFIKNKGILLSFLSDYVLPKKDLRDLVINGDFFDEWVSPMTVVTYDGKTEAEFAKAIADANSEIIEAIKTIADSGVKVYYTPGNHDMLVTQTDVSSIFGQNSNGDRLIYVDTYSPTATIGATHALDAEGYDAPGLGIYWPEINGKKGLIAIEHCHRYDLWNAPDRISNVGTKDLGTDTKITDSSILPVGYFVTKMATTHNVENSKIQTLPLRSLGSVSEITSLNSDSDTLGNLALYILAWNGMWEKGAIYVQHAKTVLTGLDGYSGTYEALQNKNGFAAWDKIPSNYDYPYLYPNLWNSNTWNEIQAKNKIVSSMYVGWYRALACSGEVSLMDGNACTQYFDASNSNVNGSTARVVVFGHTHAARLQLEENDNGADCVYANSGAWVDSSDTGTCNFTLIQPNTSQGNGVATKLTVGTFTYVNPYYSTTVDRAPITIDITGWNQ